MSWQLINFSATDGVLLSGILSCPNKPKGILIYVHGLTSSFTSEFPILVVLSKELEKIGFGVLAFNNRGYGVVNRFKKSDKREKTGFKSITIGGVYEKFEDCQSDIVGATRFITETLLCDNIILCGISTGANKSVFTLSRNKINSVSGLILLSAVSDIEAFGTDENVRKMRENANFLVKNANPNRLLDKVDDEFPFSAQRFLSLVNTRSWENTFPYIDKSPNFTALSKITQPILVVYGQNDEYMKFDKQKALDIFKSQAKKAYSMNGKIIRGASHGFDGYEKELVQVISQWIKSI